MWEAHHTSLKVARSVPVQHVLYIHSIVLSSLATAADATNAAWQDHSDTDIQPSSPCFHINIVVNNDK